MLSASRTLSCIGAASGAFLLAYWVWVGLYGVPLELAPVPGTVHLMNAPEPVRPWAPWWIPTTVSSLLAVALWRRYVLRRAPVRLRRGAAVMVVAALLSLVVASVALNIGATLQYVPRPPWLQIMQIFPLMVQEAFGMAVINLVFHGAVFVPAAALLGMLIALLTRLAAWAEGQMRSQFT